jgi:glutamate synthase (NADPH/NADH) small chain
VTPFPDLHPALDSQSALAEANRCLFCFDAPCTAACPTHIDVPRFIKKIANGNLRGSANTILDSNILGLSCSRVCPVDVLCEGSCVMHRYNKKPIEIGLLQRHAMEYFYSTPRPGHRHSMNGKRVACVGGGPASLACAAELARRGHPVTILDNRPLPGGLNAYGVAEYKLRIQDAQREVEYVRSLGVKFLQAEVGKSITLSELEDECAFIFIGVGLGSMERLGIPGEDLPHVIDALRFIAHYKSTPDYRVSGTVIVIGAGNTAIDAANAARRLGASDVRIYYRRTEAEMPAFTFEFEHAKTEGVMFHWLSQPVAILEGAVRFVKTRLGLGRKLEPVAGSEYDVPCDLVIPALGQSRLVGMLPVDIASGSIVIDRPTGRTSNPKYYAGGDCVNGGREVVDAAADGKRAALAIAEALNG